MAWSSADLEALEAAIASGTLRVKYRDKEVEYRSLDELLRARDLIRKDLAVTSGRTTRIFSEHDRGL
jgi:hypothetical protein